MKQIFPDDYSNKRFWGNVEVKGENECWLWKGLRTASGYGVISSCGKPEYATRLILFGPKPTAALLALHHCDNSLCVNPKHLYAGTHKNNTADMMRRGRHVKRGHKV